MRCPISYNSYGRVATFTSGTAGTAICVDVFTDMPVVMQLIYSVSFNISSVTIPTTAPGIVFAIKNTRGSATVGTTALAQPFRDLFHATTTIPTALGIIGESKTIFGREDEGIILNKTEEIQIYFYSTTSGYSINVMSTLNMAPITGG